jgi:hypothetical protein
VVDELEALDEHAEHQRRLLQGELAPDAGALPRTEWPERVGGQGVAALRVEVVGVEVLGIRTPDLGEPVQHRGQGDDGLPGLEGPPPADRGRFAGLAGERRRRRPQPQRLVEDLADVVELADLRDGRRHRRVGAQHPVDLLLRAGDHLGMLEQVGDHERQQPAGGLVAGDQEGQALGDDVVVGQAVPLLVRADQHVPEQVGPGVSARLALGEDRADRVVHVAGVREEAPLSPAAGLDRDREQALPGLGLLQRLHHRGDEGVLGVPVERVEAVAEPAQRDRVQRQAGHVGGDVDRLVGVHPLPLQAQLLGDVDHRVEVALHRPGAEAGQQDVVRGLPQRVVGVRGEQPRALVGLAELPLAQPDELVEAGVIAQIVHHLQAVHDVAGSGGGRQLEDGSPLAPDLHQVLDQRGLLDLEHVAQQRHALRARDVVQGLRCGGGGRGGHDGSLLRLGPVVSRGVAVPGPGSGVEGPAPWRAWRRRNTEISRTHAGKTSRAAGFLVTASKRNAASRYPTTAGIFGSTPAVRSSVVVVTANMPAPRTAKTNTRP